MESNSRRVPTKKPKRLPPLMLTLVNRVQLSEALVRLTFTGDDLTRFKGVQKGAHIKLFFALAHQTKPVLPTLGENGPQWPPQNEKPIVRTYSLRAYREAKNEIDIEFVVHGEGSDASAHSVASFWAQTAKIGAQIGLAGPGGPAPLIQAAPWHILAGDLTALPAIAGILEELPVTAKGLVFIEVPNSSFEIELKSPPNMFINWVHSEQQVNSEGGGLPLVSAVEKVLKGAALWFGSAAPSAFIAGENASTVALRDVLRERLGLTKKNCYAVPYWRRGQNEEAYHQQRHAIMDQVY
ncbi:siderophore-interacting protein [Saccharophagus degradans]|uniref:Siderophore-interacting protein n=1 Tax=Saccharophagus degradans TaxID=86304 RepID=A0AAW7XDA6_9GAMM|nr:siderophore-interacting protein [Saccharophagus degradans]MDO6424354.1 siderophore-interacting protein [Saccharophagus degradans]MDO6608439.1 siderophore-interacting protein [Saccharophagus degradans]